MHFVKLCPHFLCMQLQLWGAEGVPVFLDLTPHSWLLPWRQSHTSLPVLHQYDQWFPLSQSHTCTTPHSDRTCLTWEVTGLTHTQGNLWLVCVCVCVCACLLLQHRLSDWCVLEVRWDYVLVWCLDVGLSPNRAPLDTCSKHNSHQPLWDGAGVNHCLSPPRHPTSLSCATPPLQK